MFCLFHDCVDGKNTFSVFLITFLGGKYAEHLLVRVARNKQLPRVAKKLGPHEHSSNNIETYFPGISYIQFVNTDSQSDIRS